MDSTQAIEMAEYSIRGILSLGAALQWHFTSNHTPRIPTYLVPLAIQAIEKAEQSEWDAQLFLKDGLLLDGRNGPFSPIEIIDMMNLNAFIKLEELSG